MFDLSCMCWYLILGYAIYDQCNAGIEGQTVADTKNLFTFDTFLNSSDVAWHCFVPYINLTANIVDILKFLNLLKANACTCTSSILSLKHYFILT